MNDEKEKKRKIIIGIVLFVCGTIMISVIALVLQWRDYRAKTVNVINYPTTLPENMRDSLEIQLRNVLGVGVSVENGRFVDGEIRSGTYQELVNSQVHSANFLLDIDEYRQTFLVNMDWSDEIEVLNPILVSCPDMSLMKYPEENCLAMYNDTQDIKNIDNNPIYNDLPIVVDEFDFGARASIHYEIRGYFDEKNEIIIVINDYSGGNYEEALNKIRMLGYDLSDYNIKYIDQGGDFEI